MLKLITTIFIFVIAAFSSFSQTYIPAGDHCFDSANYVCAVNNYDYAFNHATGKDKQIAEIKLTRAKWCATHIKTANQAFVDKKYSTAKDEYQKVLDSNPKDVFAQSQIIKCDNALNPPQLRKATTAELTDIWNGKYGVQTQRRKNLINAGIDPDDAQARINAGEGKPKEAEKKATSLSVSLSTLFFTSFEEKSEQIQVHTDADSYSIPPGYIPTWCTIKTYSGYFIVIASENPNKNSRKFLFKVTAGGKEVDINVEQLGRSKVKSKKTSKTKKQSDPSGVKKCFNCPKSHDTWGLTLGYIQQKVNYFPMEVIQLGLKAEPLFKYGFGLNTGINILGYSESLIDSLLDEFKFDFYAAHVPLHLEYRLNFSKWFNAFAYGGVGFNAFSNPGFDNYSLPATFEYGGGLRISHVQLNVGISLYLGNLRHTQNLGKNTETYQKLILSVSYMF